jgi:hypothetical protein
MAKSVKHLRKGKKLEATRPLKALAGSSGGKQPVKYLDYKMTTA